MKREEDAATLLRKSRIAWGLGVICLLFLLETWNADRLMPNPASPVVWGVLGTLGALACAAGTWWGWRARRATPPGA